MDNIRVYIETFGCTFNQADSEIMAGVLSETGALLTGIDEADVIILNTCYVKHPTEHKVINRIKRIREIYPDKGLVVAGCMVEIDPQKLESISGDASWLGPHQLMRTAEVVRAAYQGHVKRITGFTSDVKVGVPRVRSNPLIHIIQICEGCSGSCSYCCTRFARGSIQSYPSDIIVQEAREAIEAGCREIQLTAQDTAAYGSDTGERLSDLIREITEIPGDFRVRVGMMHPASVLRDLDGLVEAFRSEKVYSFLHLPVQSGSDRVLRDMGRGHTVDDFRMIVDSFRSRIPEISIATDIIVGYPTEGDDDFLDTCRLLEEVRPGFIHLSKYRHRPRALSSSLDEIDFRELRRRSKAVEELKGRITEEENRRLVGTTQNILIVERGRKGGLIGRTDSYIPVVTHDGEVGSFRSVRIQRATGTYLIAESEE